MSAQLSNKNFSDADSNQFNNNNSKYQFYQNIQVILVILKLVAIHQLLVDIMTEPITQGNFSIDTLRVTLLTGNARVNVLVKRFART